jgi:hypothetical protein
MAADQLILKRGKLNRPSGNWQDEDYGVLDQGKDVGRIYLDRASGTWFWGLAYGYHKDRTPTHGREPTREAAMAAFRKSWDRT